MSERLKPWYPIEGADEELDLETVTKGLDYLEATLSRGQGSERTLVINFGNPIAFRVYPKHALLKQLPSFPNWNGTLYIVENSDFRGWLESASLGIIKDPFRHYRIVSVDGCLDVLTLADPVAEWRPSVVQA